MRLAQWLGYHQKSQIWLCKKIGASKSSVSMWCRDLYPPPVEMVQKIYLLTGGQVGLWDYRTETSKQRAHASPPSTPNL